MSLAARPISERQHLPRVGRLSKLSLDRSPCLVLLPPLGLQGQAKVRLYLLKFGLGRSYQFVGLILTLLLLLLLEMFGGSVKVKWRVNFFPKLFEVAGYKEFGHANYENDPKEDQNGQKEVLYVSLE